MEQEIIELLRNEYKDIVLSELLNPVLMLVDLLVVLAT
jgi:hypothetical protein